MADPFNTKQQQQLTQVLQHEINCAEQMLLALQAETTALSEHTPEALELVIQAKLEKMQQLEQASNQREHLLTTITSLSTKPRNIKSRSTEPSSLKPDDVFGQDQSLQLLWKTLMLLAEQCQQLNFVNGSIVERGYQQSRYALDILQGRTAFDNTDKNAVINGSDGYNHNGQTTYSKRSRPIAQV